MNHSHAMSTPRALTGHRTRLTVVSLAMLALLAACSPDNIIGNAKLPPDVIDPGRLHNVEGALAAYRSASDLLRRGLNFHVRASGLLSDELTTASLMKPAVTRLDWYEYLDGRHTASHDLSAYSPYTDLNRTRGQVRQALGMLREYAPQSSPALQGHLYAMDGYAKVMLAELFCSGIPLSELVYKGDYRLEGGSTTSQVLERAIASFDTAAAVSADSARLLDFARVGRGRALLGLGRYAEAAEAVADVSTGYAYAVQYPPDSLRNLFSEDQWSSSLSAFNVSDREGLNGLPFRSSGDPRTAAVLRGVHALNGPQYYPAKYNKEGSTPIVLASGVEARLIEAEAALAAGGDWLRVLNDLRTNGTFTTRPNAADPAVTDTVWNAGTGNVAGLAPLADPGMPGAREDLLFHERASWLYLTGHRLGDMRRLVRQYGRSPDAVFPNGRYMAGLEFYGESVSLPVPREEISFNPLYNGCLSEEA